jgi:hypothetical protein
VAFSCVTDCGHVSISGEGDPEFRTVFGCRAKLSPPPQKERTLLRKCPIPYHLAKQLLQQIVWWGKHPMVSTRFPSWQECLWQKKCTASVVSRSGVRHVRGQFCCTKQEPVERPA